MRGSEERKATGAFAFTAGDGAARSGTGPLEISDAGVGAGGTTIEFLDVDAVDEGDRDVTLRLFPAGSLRLSQLARRHETFVKVLREAWYEARTGGLLAHGIAAPATFAGTVRRPPPERPASLLIYPTHLTVVPSDGGVFQVPFGAVETVTFDGAAWNVSVSATGGPFDFSQLARQTDPFFHALEDGVAAQARRLSEISDSSLFADGNGVEASKLDRFDQLLESWTAPERLDGAKALVAAGERAKTRLGLVELLDPDEEGLAAKEPLPPNVAAFLLVPRGGEIVLEILSGPSAATYLFRGEMESLNRDLQAIHFRRRPLSLTEKEVEGSAGRPYRLAFRKLEPLRRLRAATTGRILHTEGWKDQVVGRIVSTRGSSGS